MVMFSFEDGTDARIFSVHGLVCSAPSRAAAIASVYEGIRNLELSEAEAEAGFAGPGATPGAPAETPAGEGIKAARADERSRSEFPALLAAHLTIPAHATACALWPVSNANPGYARANLARLSQELDSFETAFNQAVRAAGHISEFADYIRTALAGHANCLCDDCGKKWHSGDLDHVWPDIPSLGNRTTPGATIPSGTCNDCGALCYPMGPGEAHNA